MPAKTENVPVNKRAQISEQSMKPASGAHSPFSSLRGELDRVFNRFFSEDWPHIGMGRLMELEPFSRVGGTSLQNMLQGTRADISETDSEYEISVEPPGIEEKDIELDLTDETLTLSAEKREERDERKKNYHLSECSYGSVRRSFRVPEGVDSSKIKADFSKGVLRVTLPKTREAKAKQRRIPVKGA